MFENLLPLFLACLVLMIKPGPYMMTLIGLSSAGHWRSMWIFIFGYFVGSAVLYYFLLLSFNLLPSGFGVIFIFLKAIAAVLFVSMGLKGFSETVSDYKSASKTTEEKLTKSSMASKWIIGFLLILSNPYDYVFILVAVPSIIDQTTFSIMDITYIMIVRFVADVIVQSSYLLPIFLIRKKINDDFLRKLRIVSSVLIILIGLYIASTIIFTDVLKHIGLLSQSSL